MKPSLLLLFKRGRYSHPNPESISGDADGTPARRGTAERERFAAAAIAFAWQHDRAFRQHFWRKICTLPGHPRLSNDARIEVEPYRWSDLLIINPAKGKSYVYAVECKLFALLSRHQNPAQRQFASKAGYGRMMVDHAELAHKEVHFRVLGCSERVRTQSHP